MASPAVLITTKPDAGSGLPTGLGDWRLAVEIMLPNAPLNRWGVGVWGTAQWGDFAWFDLTPYLRGAAWNRGATEFDGNPEVGTANLSLDNNARPSLWGTDVWGVDVWGGEARKFSPWNTVSSFQGTVLAPIVPTSTGPSVWGSAIWNTSNWGASLPFAAAYSAGFLGQLIRVVAHSPSGMVNPISAPADPLWNTAAWGAATWGPSLFPASPDSWAPQFTGIVETWVDSNTGNGADSQVDVTLIETASLLARIDLNAQGVVGLADLPGARISRLTTAAAWLFGVVDQLTYEYIGSGQYTMQSTDMSMNRWAEILLTAESFWAIVRTHRNGSIVLHNRYRVGDMIANGPERYDTWLYTNRYVADSQRPVDNEDNIVNDIGIARAGGAEQTGTDQTSVNVFGTRTFRRTNWLGQSDGIILDHIIPRILNARALSSRRLEAIELHHAHSPATIIALDLGDRIDVQLPPLGAQTVRANDCTVDALAHLVIVTNNGLAAWRATVTFGAQSAFTT